MPWPYCSAGTEQHLFDTGADGASQHLLKCGNDFAAGGKGVFYIARFSYGHPDFRLAYLGAEHFVEQVVSGPQSKEYNQRHSPAFEALFPDDFRCEFAIHFLALL